MILSMLEKLFQGSRVEFPYQGDSHRLEDACNDKRWFVLNGKTLATRNCLENNFSQLCMETVFLFSAEKFPNCFLRKKHVLLSHRRCSKHQDRSDALQQFDRHGLSVVAAVGIAGSNFAASQPNRPLVLDAKPVLLQRKSFGRASSAPPNVRIVSHAFNFEVRLKFVKRVQLKFILCKKCRS